MIQHCIRPPGTQVPVCWKSQQQIKREWTKMSNEIDEDLWRNENTTKTLIGIVVFFQSFVNGTSNGIIWLFLNHFWTFYFCRWKFRLHFKWQKDFCSFRLLPNFFSMIFWVNFKRLGRKNDELWDWLPANLDKKSIRMILSGKLSINK